jgi:hypothetical protein
MVGGGTASNADELENSPKPVLRQAYYELASQSGSECEILRRMTPNANFKFQVLLTLNLLAAREILARGILTKRIPATVSEDISGGDPDTVIAGAVLIPNY